MAYNQPQHGGAADGYYNEQNVWGGRPYEIQNPPAQQQSYQQSPLNQYTLPQQDGAPPPQYNKRDEAHQPDYGNGQKMDFEQTFKISQPKYNDIWAAILFWLTFAGFAVVSGLSIYGYSKTMGQQGTGIYNSSNTVSLNTNTVLLL